MQRLSSPVCAGHFETGLAVHELCRSTVWVLEQRDQKPASAFDRQLAKAAALILADKAAMDAFLPMMVAIHRWQAGGLLSCCAGALDFLCKWVVSSVCPGSSIDVLCN